jgi:hypothetical protein
MCLGVISPSYAQWIGNKLNLYAGYEIGNFHGPDLVTSGPVKFPSLFSNLKELSGYSVGGTYQLGDYFSLGIAVERLTGSGWELAHQHTYYGSKVNLTSVSPSLRIHSRVEREGLFNRIKLFAEISPVLGSARLILPDSLYAVVIDGTVLPIPKTGLNNFRGLAGKIGFDFDITQGVGFHMDYGIHYHWIQSPLYMDQHFSYLLANIGLYLRLGKERRYYY